MSSPALPYHARKLCVAAGVGEPLYGEPPLSSHEEALQSIRKAADSVTVDIHTAVEAMRLRKELGLASPDAAPLEGERARRCFTVSL